MPRPKIHEIMRGKENLYLLEMKELPLKSLQNFRSALNGDYREQAEVLHEETCSFYAGRLA